MKARRFLSLLVVFVLGSAHSVSFSSVTPSVIYGEDGRVDYFEITDPSIRKLSESVGAFFFATDLSFLGRQARFSAPSYQKYQDLCPDQPFLNQPTAAFCSGFLVGSDLVATAGHCVKTDEECFDIRVAFGFRMNSAQEVPESIDAEDIYSCRKIIARKFLRSGLDYALIRLDRPVKDRAPLAVNTSGSLKAGAELFLLGHPVGLPLKMTDGARVRRVGDGIFTTNADAFGGNSGSPLINPSTLAVEGLLARGETDFERDEKRGCNVEKRCTENGCGGETATLGAVLMRPFSWKNSQPQIEEAIAHAHPVSGKALLRSLIRVPSELTPERFELSIEVYSPKDRSFDLAHRQPLLVERYGGQRSYEIAFSVWDSSLLDLGVVKGRITLWMAGEARDSVEIPIFAASDFPSR